METRVFLEKLKEALEEDQTLQIDSKFSELGNFDSMSIMILIAFVDEYFEKKISASQFKEIKNVKDLMHAIGDQHFQ